MTTHIDFGGHVYDVCLARQFDEVPRGHGRLETVFKYPDGASVDLFLVFDPQGRLDGFKDPPILSDLGQTTSWLADMMIKPWLSKKRQRFVEDVLARLAVRQRGGAFETPFDPTNESLEDAIVRLGQACVRISGELYR